MAAEGVSPTPATFNTLVDGYVAAGQLQRAEGVMRDARAAGVALDAWAYTSLLKGQAAAGNMPAAAEVLGAMQAAGVKPTAVTYTTLVDGHVRAGDVPAARAALDAMRAAGEAPTVVTYNSLLRGHATTAAAAAERLRRTAGWTTSGSGCEAEDRAAAAARALQSSLEVLREMLGSGVAPCTATYNTLMSAALAAADWDLIRQLHRRLLGEGLRPDSLTYTILIQAHARQGQLRDAISSFEALSRDRGARLDLPAYNATVDALARAGDMPAAERLLTAACSFAKTQGEELAWGGQGGDGYAVEDLYRMGYREAGHQLNLPSCVRPPLPAGLPPPVEGFGALVSGYARLREVAPAMDAVKRFHSMGGTPDVQMLDVLVNLAVRSGTSRSAMRCVGGWGGVGGGRTLPCKEAGWLPSACSCTVSWVWALRGIPAPDAGSCARMELLGVEVNRAKYRALVEQLQQQQRSREEAAAAAAGSGKAASQRPAARRRRPPATAPGARSTRPLSRTRRRNAFSFGWPAD